MAHFIFYTCREGLEAYFLFHDVCILSIYYIFASLAVETNKTIYRLNFGFMIIQAFYGFVTDSLGLLSDSIHMFFDCVALLVGLLAAVMSKWPKSQRFPYGFGKVETLSGFANGILLMYVFIVPVAICRHSLTSLFPLGYSVLKLHSRRLNDYGRERKRSVSANSSWLVVWDWL